MTLRMKRGLMKVEHPHLQELSQDEAIYLGEDVILRDSMIARHKIIYLPDVGGTDLRISLEDRAPIQARTGVRYYQDGKPMGYVLAQSIMYGRGTLLGTYADLLFREKGGAALFLGYVGSIAYWGRTAGTYLLRRAKSTRQDYASHYSVRNPFIENFGDCLRESAVDLFTN